MPENKRVIVIGAGMAGLSTAWHLQHSGVEVTVVDRRGLLNGTIIDRADSGELFANPQDPYTQKLLDAVPSLEVTS